MANPPNPDFLQVNAGPIHNDQELCQFLLHRLGDSCAMDILPSKIHINGTGLFAKEAIPQGSEVFRSMPLVSCVGDGQHRIICDYCYTSTASRINAEGNFRTQGDVMPTITMCERCGKCGYCSMVRILAYYLEFRSVNYIKTNTCQDCQAMSWEMYHKFECDALRQFPSSTLWTRMLYRVLAMHEGGYFLKQELQALCYLWGHREHNVLGIGSDAMIGIANHAKILIQSRLGNELIRDLLLKVRPSL